MTHGVASSIDLVATIAVAAGVVGVTAARQRAERARLYAVLLDQLIRQLGATSAELAGILGTSALAIEEWTRVGVPPRWQPSLVHLLRTTVALRRCLTPLATRRLLLLRLRGRSSTMQQRRPAAVAAPKRAYERRGVIITVR